MPPLPSPPASRQLLLSPPPQFCLCHCPQRSHSSSRFNHFPATVTTDVVTAGSITLTAAIAVAFALVATVTAVVVTNVAAIAVTITVTVTVSMAAAATNVTAATVAADSATTVAAVVVDIVALTAAITATVAFASSVATAIALTDVVTNATALTRQKAEVPVDGRRRRDERRHDNQTDERDKRGAMRGCVATRGGGAGEREASA